MEMRAKQNITIIADFNRISNIENISREYEDISRQGNQVIAQLEQGTKTYNEIWEELDQAGQLNDIKIYTRVWSSKLAA